MKLIRWFLVSASWLCLSACSESNDPFTGQVSADMGRHHVAVEGCTVWGMPKVEDLPGGGQRFAPCKNAVVVIQNERVSVNGNDLGELHDQDSVIVKKGNATIVPLQL